MLEPLHSELLSSRSGIGHGFFTRAGGVSAGIYGSLNCGLGSKDERANVLENRSRVAAHFGAQGSQLLTCHQIHSALAVFVEKPWAFDAQPKADAIVTRTPGLVLGALAADCTPILFADPKARVIAAAHAGWKGALSGILEATLDAMEAAGARRADITAAVGPCISQTAYEVGPEFETAFLRVDETYSRYFKITGPGAKAHFDLPGFVVDRLVAAGTGHVDNATQCTYAGKERFFSYRRTTHLRQADYGRQVSAVVLL